MEVTSNQGFAARPGRIMDSAALMYKPLTHLFMECSESLSLGDLDHPIADYSSAMELLSSRL